MPVTIRHWMNASSVMFAGAMMAAVISPPKLVTKPPTPAYRTWFSITSWIALSTLPCCSRSWASAARAAGGMGPTPTIARCSASRTNDAVRPGASSVTIGTKDRAAWPARARLTLAMRKA